MYNSSDGWINFKNYINSFKNGDIIYRKDIVNIVDCSHSTVDNYRNALCHLDFLKWIKLGTYKKLNNIPKTMTSSKLMELAFGKNKNKKVKIIRKIKLDEINEE